MATAPDGSTVTPNTPSAGTSPVQDDATLRAVQAEFDRLGLGSLMGHIIDLYKQGVKDPASILFRLQDTEEYKKRFAGNDLRIKNGYKPMTVEEYVKYEDSVRALMKKAMLPEGFYDQQEDFHQLMAHDIAPDEVQARVTMAQTAAVNADPSLVTALRDMYGVNDSDIVAYFLDPERARPLLESRFNAAQVNAAASKVGAHFSNQFAEEVGGVTKGERAGLDAIFSGVRDDLAAADRLNSVQQGDLSAEDLARAAFNMDGAGAAAEKRRKLASKERAAFSGGAAASSGALGQTKRL